MDQGAMGHGLVATKRRRPQNDFLKDAYVIQFALRELHPFAPQFVTIGRHLLNDALQDLVPSSQGKVLASWNENPGTATYAKCDLRKDARQLRTGLTKIVQAGGLIAGRFLSCASTHSNFPYSADCFVFKAVSQPLETQNVHVCATL
jgi:hypothetical protein